MNKLLSVFGVCLLLASCSTVKFIPPQPRQIQNTFPYDKPFDAVWQAAIEAIAELNLPISNFEKDSGLITTEWMNFPAQNPKDGYCDCGQTLVPTRGDDKVPYKARATYDVRGHFNIFVKKLEQGRCEIKINSVFESGRMSCVSTGRLEAGLNKIIQKKIG
jgi:hypothetical protein